MLRNTKTKFLQNTFSSIHDVLCDGSCNDDGIKTTIDNLPNMKDEELQKIIIKHMKSCIKSANSSKDPDHQSRMTRMSIFIGTLKYSF